MSKMCHGTKNFGSQNFSKYEKVFLANTNFHRSPQKNNHLKFRQIRNVTVWLRTSKSSSGKKSQMLRKDLPKQPLPAFRQTPGPKHWPKSMARRETTWTIWSKPPGFSRRACSGSTTRISWGCFQMDWWTPNLANKLWCNTFQHWITPGT